MLEFLVTVFAVCFLVRLVGALLKGGVEALTSLILHPLHSLAVILGFLLVAALLGALAGL